MITYTYEKGIIVHDVIGEKILINVRKKNFLNQPSFKYALPNSSKILSFKNTELLKTTKIALKNLLNNKNYVKIDTSLEALKTIICAIQSSKLKEKLKIKDMNKNIKYPFA